MPGAFPRKSVHGDIRCQFLEPFVSLHQLFAKGAQISREILGETTFEYPRESLFVGVRGARSFSLETLTLSLNPSSSSRRGRCRVQKIWTFRSTRSKHSDLLSPRYRWWSRFGARNPNPEAELCTPRPDSRTAGLQTLSTQRKALRGGMQKSFFSRFRRKSGRSWQKIDKTDKCLQERAPNTPNLTLSLNSPRRMQIRAQLAFEGSALLSDSIYTSSSAST